MYGRQVFTASPSELEVLKSRGSFLSDALAKAPELTNTREREGVQTVEGMYAFEAEAFAHQQDTQDVLRIRSVPGHVE
jgi:hypothetical protein